MARARGASHRTLGLLSVATAVLCFSVSSSIVKWSGTPGSVLAFWRMLGAVVVWWVVARLSGSPVTWTSIRRTFVPGVLFGLNLALFFTAVTRTSIAHAEFIGALTPLLLVPAGAVLFKERVVRRALAWGSLALVGVAIVLFNSPASGSSSTSGDLLVAVAVLLWAGYLLSTKRVRGGMDVAQFMGSVMPVGTLTLVPIVVVRGEITEVGGKGWVAVVLLLLLTGIGAHGLIVFAQRHLPVATISILQVAQPALAVMWAFLILGESIRPLQVVGMVLVISGLALFILQSNRSSVAPATLALATEGELAGPAG